MGRHWIREWHVKSWLGDGAIGQIEASLVKVCFLRPLDGFVSAD
jgi:hypothetical protein